MRLLAKCIKRGFSQGLANTTSGLNAQPEILNVFGPMSTLPIPEVDEGEELDLLLRREIEERPPVEGPRVEPLARPHGRIAEGPGHPKEVLYVPASPAPADEKSSRAASTFRRSKFESSSTCSTIRARSPGRSPDPRSSWSIAS